MAKHFKSQLLWLNMAKQFKHNYLKLSTVENYYYMVKLILFIFKIMISTKHG